MRAARIVLASLAGLAVAACGGDIGVSAHDGPGPGDDGGPGLEAGVEAGPGDAAGADGGGPWAGTLAVTVGAVTSSTVPLAWDPVDGATELEVWIGPEPSAAADGSLPDGVRVATLPGTAAAYTLEGLAAAVDVFVHVAAVGTPEPVWGNAHARTVGGPRAPLDTPLREVHAYGPAVLMLVLENTGPHFDGSTLTGNLGPAWQGGTWTVTRRDGGAVGVTAVHRHTVPISQPNYPVGFDQWGDDNDVDVDHRIFLVLDADIGAREVLTVAHAGDAGTELEALVPFSDRYLETPLIQVNQVGYNPRASRRWAYVSGWMGDGGAADLGGLPAAAEVLIEPLDPLAPRPLALGGLPLAVRAANDADAGGEVREIDLAALPAAEGVRYRVRIPGVGVSWPTAVSEEAAFKAFYVVARGMFLNRWCGDLRADLTEWSRPPDHCAAYFVTGRSFQDGFFPQTTSQTDERPLEGGHHDAGDFDLRPFHVLVGQYLMRGVEVAAASLADGQLTIPESANGIPDLLDEALWSVAAWAQLQNPDGSVRAGAESWAHPRGIYLASNDQLPYWTFDPEPFVTAYASGLFAQAAHLVAPYDATRATALEAAARSAYARAVAQGAPEEYRLYGAGELFRLTGEASFGADYQALWAAIDAWGNGAFDNIVVAQKMYPGAFTGYTPAMADFTVAYAESAGADAAIRTVTLDELTTRADEAAASVIDSPWAHRSGRLPGVAPDWGVATGTGRQVDMIFQRLQLGGLPDEARQRYFDAMSLAADWVLGCNPASYVYITGLGSRHPEEALHTDSLALIKTQGMPPMPGIPVYGMVQSFPGAAYYAPIGAAFHPAFNAQPLGFHLSDTRASVNMNEFSVHETQAPLTELFAALIAPGMLPPASWKPGGSEHRSPLPGHSAE